MIKSKPKKSFLTIFVIFCLFSCKKEKLSNDVNYKTPKYYEKVVIVYMEANNDLRLEAISSINKMELGASGIDGILLAYVKTSNNYSYLLKIKYDENISQIKSDTIKTFFSNSPSSPKFMKSVLDWTQKRFRSNHYGLVLWSHSTSWIPPSNSPRTKAFGRDRGHEMDILDLREALPNNFEFIIFDSCNMSSIEVLFEFKDKTNYIIASPTETLAESLPYHIITPLLFKGVNGLIEVAKSYFQYYDSQYSGPMRSATISVIKTSELSQIAKEFNKLLQTQKKQGDELKSTNVQRMDFSSNFPIPTYDFISFVEANFDLTFDNSVKLSLDKAIIYRATTKSFLDIPINEFSGISCYVPKKNDVNLYYYKKLQWYRDSGLYTIVEVI